MFSTSILEVAIGLVFIYLLMSLIYSAVTEIIESNFFRLLINTSDSF